MAVNHRISMYFHKRSYFNKTILLLQNDFSHTVFCKMFQIVLDSAIGRNGPDIGKHADISRFLGNIQKMNPLGF